MKFTMTVDLDAMTDDPAREVVRILRYWSQQIDADDIRPGSGANVYDTSFTKVGRWEVSGQATKPQN